jgi:putative oxidoreductase
MNFPAFRRPLPVVLRVLLSLGFLGAAIGKFLPQSGWEARFAGWGYPTWFVPVVGALEVLGVIGLWLPRVSQQAMVLLAIVLLEASYANLSHPPIAQAVRPAVFLILLLGLFITQRMPRRIAASSPA